MAPGSAPVSLCRLCPRCSCSLPAALLTLTPCDLSLGLVLPEPPRHLPVPCRPSPWASPSSLFLLASVLSVCSRLSHPRPHARTHAVTSPTNAVCPRGLFVGSPLSSTGSCPPVPYVAPRPKEQCGWRRALGSVAMSLPSAHGFPSSFLSLLS